MVANSDLPLQENEFLPPISRWNTFGGLFIVCILGLSIPVTAVAKYKVTVKGQAVVRPTGELRIVQATAEGQVMQIYVKANQVVKKGDAIAFIDDSRLQTKKSQLQTSTQQAKLQITQINAQISTLDNQIRAETERVKRVVASAEAELIGNSRTYQDKKVITFAEFQEADAYVNMAEDELLTAQAQLQSAQSNLGATEATLGAARSKRNRYESVAKQGALSQDQFEEAQLTVKQQEKAVQSHQATVEAQKQSIERLKKAVKAAIARRQRSQVTVNPSNAEVKIATERIAQEKASGEASKAILEKERQALINQKIEVQKQLQRDARELKQIEIELKETTVTATADGIISKLNLRNAGQTLRLGEEIAQIAPNNTPLIVKAAVESEHKSKLRIGQNVRMRVSACPYPDHGTLSGKVKSISPDATTRQNHHDVVDKNNNPQPTAVGAFYEVTIEPNTLSLGKKKKCYIQLGMDGRVDIISREETVLKFFLRKARLIADV
jgi:multidrug efflux pump subunit AcrA (membrane-fusion protein)